jgi:hypothetical protein
LKDSNNLISNPLGTRGSRLSPHARCTSMTTLNEVTCKGSKIVRHKHIHNIHKEIILERKTYNNGISTGHYVRACTCQV